jgi:hypothetical protein
LPPCPDRDAWLKKVRQTETAMRLDKWTSSPAGRPNKSRSRDLSVAESNLDRFSVKPKNASDRPSWRSIRSIKRAWLQLAEDWVKLARAAKALDV